MRQKKQLISYSIESEKIEAQDSASANIKKMDGNYFNADLTYGIALDKRDQSFKPTEGYKVKFVQSLPLVQDSSSIYNSIDIKTYHDFSDDIIGSVKFLGRTITGIDDDVRLTERLYIPRNTLRGFEVRKVGPKDGQDYIGGNYLAGLSTEAQLPNLLPESYNTDFTVFLDTANIFATILSYSTLDS